MDTDRSDEPEQAASTPANEDGDYIGGGGHSRPCEYDRNMVGWYAGLEQVP